LLPSYIYIKWEQKKNSQISIANAKRVYWNKRAKKYIASVQIDEEAIILGAFETEEEAREAYFDAIEKYLLPP
jgi:hypothetical protein